MAEMVAEALVEGVTTPPEVMAKLAARCEILKEVEDIDFQNFSDFYGKVEKTNEQTGNA